MSKLLRDMTPGEIGTYLNLVATATATVVPEDAIFILILFDQKGKAHYVTSVNNEDLPSALREVADEAEQRGAPCPE